MTMELSAMTMDDAVEEIMRIHRLLPVRPGIDEVVAARTLIQNVEKEDQLRLEAIAKQSKGKDVPEELFRILQEMHKNIVHFQSKEQKRDAEKLLDLEGVHLAFDDLIQRASQCLQPISGSQSSASRCSSSSSVATTGDFEGCKVLVSQGRHVLAKPKTSFFVDGVGLGVRPRDALAAPQIVDSTLKPIFTSGQDDEKLSLIKLASLIEVSAKKGTQELILQGKLSDQIEWLPDSIGKLSSLITFDVSENKIAILPDAIGGLFSLQTLDLHGNRYKNCQNQFRELNLSSNGLTALPETIGSLVRLQKLNIETNEIEEIPHSIGRCTSLKELHADYNRLKALPEAVGRIESLEILTLRYNNIKQLPTTMASLSSLRELDVSFNELETIPESLCFATTLVKLDVSNNFADLQHLPRSIGNLEMLEELYSHNNQIRVLPDSFGMLTRLRVLNVEGNPLVEPPRDVIEKGAQAVVSYMADRVAQKDSKPQAAKQKKSWARNCFFQALTNASAIPWKLQKPNLQHLGKIAKFGLLWVKFLPF
ncbi:UNVERIFIED_CONTAM: Plant intracellular Ras-group-related LRR protein 4 [Sesamum angustifolium]|uniref:Plant intracellular Ras-group-related LRR protein 4 n=1 Tax=Sesamum angustifolium TaxID=2727405 RepID=A0AAW2RNV9_9LAMI